ncbi:MAG: DUF2218 domain-containing protein [Xanthomonadaceae bacterium]|jgi:hypothetical protein|nr:DUF2218 domain-containing protein [Xanthomonadaceae bacterium]
MSLAHADLRGTDAVRLLRTLCNHWRHKFEIRRDHDHHAHIPFASDIGADFTVAGDVLTIRIDAAPEQMAHIQQVITDHLRRFARDETLHFDWRESPR